MSGPVVDQRIVIEVFYADGGSFDQTFDSDSIVVGTGSGADLRIPRAPEVDAEHLLIMPRQNGTWISAGRNVRVRPLVGGVHFENGLLPFGTEIDIGSVTLRAQRPRVERKVQPRRLLMLSLAGTVLFLLYVMWKARRPGMPDADSQPPALFGELPKSCPDEVNPLVRAREALASGDALDAQYAYDPQKGIAGVAELGVAETCAAAARHGGLRAEAEARRKALEARIEGDFKAQKAALDRALALDDLPAILRADNALLPYLTHRPSEYSRWLLKLERHVSLRMEELKEGKKKGMFGGGN